MQCLRNQKRNAGIDTQGSQGAPQVACACQRLRNVLLHMPAIGGKIRKADGILVMNRQVREPRVLINESRLCTAQTQTAADHACDRMRDDRRRIAAARSVGRKDQVRLCRWLRHRFGHKRCGQPLNGWIAAHRHCQLPACPTRCGQAFGQMRAGEPPALAASAPAILTTPFAERDVRWAPSTNHYLNWLEAIETRRDPIAPVEQAVRSLQACATAWISMKLGRPVRWDPQREEFPGDAEANALRHRMPRSSRFDVHRLVRG